MNKYKTTQFSLGLVISAMLLTPGCFHDAKKETEPSNSQVTSSSTNSNDTSTVYYTKNGTPFITEQDLENELKDIPKEYQNLVKSNPQFMSDVLKSLVATRLSHELAAKEGWDKDKELEKILRMTKEQYYIQNKFSVKALEKVDLSDAALKQFFEKTKSDPRSKFSIVEKEATVNIKSIEFKNEADAKSFLEKARKDGSSFESVAKEEGKEIKDLNIKASEFKIGNHFVANQQEKKKIFDLQPSQTDIVKVSDDVYLVVKSVAREEEKFKSFEEVKENLKDLKKQQELPDLMNKLIDDLKTDFNVKETQVLEELKSKKSENTPDMQDELLKQLEEMQQEESALQDN